MPRNICLAFTCFGSLFLLTSSVSADRAFIFVRLLFTQQPGNTHGIYQSTTSLTYHQSLTKLITNHLDPLPIYPLHPLRDRRKYIPRNRSGLRRKLGGQDRLLSLGTYQDRLFTNVDRFKMRNVNHGLVHGNSAKEWTTFSADKHVGVPA